MKIIFSDFDKTLYDLNYLNNIKAINKFVELGNKFVIITGRSLKQLLPDIKDYNIKYDYLICNDGGTIYNKNKKEIYKVNIEEDVVKDIYYLLKEDRSINNCYIDTSTYFTDDLNSQANGIIGTYNDYNKAYKLLIKILEKYPNVTGYLSDNWVNIKSIKATKDQAIRYLINKLNIDRKNLITVGDSINDLSMLLKYDGYCMSCSKEEIKKKIKKEINTLEELIEKIKDED